MQKTIPLIFWVLLLCFKSTAQQHTAKTLNLQVLLSFPKNDTANATVTLLNADDSAVISTKIAIEKSINFSVAGFHKYIVRVTSASLETAEKTIGLTDKNGSLFIQLNRKTKALKEITVTSRHKPIIKQEDDKTIVDAEPLANSSSNAYEVMEKVPGAVVDQDGNVYLNSMTPAVIQINGKEVKLSAADLASLLKSLPAGSISKMEILRNPSAKYDAASTGGILNIVLKKGVKLGSSGSVNAGYFQGVYHTKYSGYSLNKNSDKISAYLNQNIMQRNNYEELNSNRIIQIDNSTLAQKAFTKYPSLNFYTGGGMDYTFNKKLNIGIDTRLSLNKNESNTDNSNILTSNSSQPVLSKSQAVTGNTFKSIYFSQSASSKYKIDTLGSEWTAQAEYNYFKNNSNQLYNNQYIQPVQPTLFGDGKTNAYKNNWMFKTDLVVKLKNKFTVEAGAKINTSNSKNATDYFKQSGSNARKVDSFQTNTFKYTETITAAYLQLAKTFAGFTLKPGLRLETTGINGHQLIPKDTSFTINRTDLFPYVYLRHNLIKMMGFQLVGNLIFRKSITRPYYEALNPYQKYIDPYLFESGNPALKPQLTTNYEFNITADDFPVFSAGINNTKNIFSNVTYQDDITKIAYRTYDNLGSNKEYYLRLFGGIPPGGKFTFYTGVQYNYNMYNGVYQNQLLNYNRGSYTFFLYQELKINKTLRTSMHGFMRTKGLQNFYELENFGALWLDITKTFFKQKFTVSLSGNDILKTNKINFTLKQANINAYGSRINDTRRIGLTVRYNFGIKPKEEKSRRIDMPQDGNN
jgi:hypothetical protein